MKNAKQVLALILCLAMLLAVAVGCSQSESKDPSSETPSASDSSAAPAGDDSSASDSSEGLSGKITYMSIWGVDQDSVDITSRRTQVEKFLADNPDVTIENNSIAHDDFVVKIKALIAADDMPDLWSARGDMLPAAVDADEIYDKDEIFAAAGIDGWEEMFIDGSFSDFLYNGKYWAIPGQFQGCSYLFCNMDLLKECGIDKAPETWSELLDTIAKVKEKGMIPLAMGNKSQSPVGDCIMSSLCDRYTGTDWFYSMKEIKGARFTDDQFVNALKALKELVDAGAFNADANSLDEDMGRAYYANGQSPMFFSGAWSTDWIELNCSEEIINATKLVLFPSVDGAVGEQNAVSGGAGWGHAISKTVEGDNFKAAATMVYYLTNYDYATEALKVGYVRYPSKAPEGADFSNVGPVTQQYLDSLSSSTFCPDYYVLMESAPLETYGAVIQEIMIGTTTPEDGAKRIDDAYEQYVVNK